MVSQNWRRSLLPVLLVLVFVLGALAGPAMSRLLVRPAQAAGETQVYDSKAIANIAEAAAPAVVSVIAYVPSRRTQDEQFFRQFNTPHDQTDQTPNNQYVDYGTGFVIRPDGYILTNAHVIQGASKVEVKIQNQTLAAKVVGSSSLLDLAVLKIATSKDLPVLTMGDSGAMRPGEWVVAIGNPFGYDHSVTAGVLSATGRSVQVAGGQGQATHSYDDLLQTDAAINPGNSGGPLLNLNGQVIGINAVVSTEGQGIGFAIPINVARDALDQLIRTGHYQRSWLGVSVIDLAVVDSATRQKYKLPAGDGVFIGEVVKGSPADEAGLTLGDAILAIDGKPLHDAAELVAAVRGHKVGDRIRLTVVHRGNQGTLDVVLAAQPDN